MTQGIVFLAQAVVNAEPSLPHQILHSIPWWAWIAIVAIVSSSVSEILKASFRHTERIAMIRMGMHPDASNSNVGLVDEKPGFPEAAEL